ncbi:glycoside hydrolase family 73 protein [Clostridium celatum]|uniref:Mannosyl-glycoprotein endo-beta-N-acetylglucosaminidase n=1 Tax=Clostridium celatum DSM 1785 TaxID=545697 RepID=L1QEA6_9CLOT|nr:glucosaminidase domain-containing protein [Clostridium celatum]EKY26293.1 mannosyl-glycoprotein endo-beta-N-acetylglucosaminidase [Clostridium celatum DSM 1785]MCE9653980.1 glucosaminidase domain-containing protein [Clostridium celatum]
MKGNLIYNGVDNYKAIDKRGNIINTVIILSLVIVLIISSGNLLKRLVFTNNIDAGYNNEDLRLSENNESNKSNESNIEDNTEKQVYVNSYLNEEENSFINLILDGAIENYKEYKILPSITIGQAILESGWGKSELAVSHNNLFGIKADSRWDGAVAAINSKENYNDSYISNFRKYDSIEESIEDHGRFLFDSDRYRDNGLFEGKTYIEQAQALEDAGYSTAKDESGVPIYADKLIAIIEKYHLMDYDKQIV